MFESLTLNEPSWQGYQPPRPFGLSGDGAAPHEIIRLLLGSVNVVETSTGRVSSLTTNEFRQTARRMCRPDRISAFLFDGDITLTEYETFITALSSRNSQFFESLRQEIALALICKKARRFTESFLYFYRVLEMTAVAFPLLYATTQSEFAKAHEFLRSLLSNEKDGDLKVLSKAVPIIAKQANIEGVMFDFSIAGCEESWVSELKRQMQFCRVDKETAGFEFQLDGDSLFRVPFNSMPALLVQFRNRMFHYRVGQKNFDLGAIGGSERICEMLVAEAAHWFALIYAEILRVMAKRQF